MPAESSIRRRPSLSLAGAQALIDAAVAQASEMGVAVTIVVVDEIRGREGGRTDGRCSAGERPNCD